jgi:SAM-dependent methyltransferase
MQDGSALSAIVEEMSTGFMKSQVLYVTVKLGIAHHLAAGPLSNAALAGAVGADPMALYRLLRALEYLGFLTEPDPGIFSLTPLGKELQRSSAGGGFAQVLFDIEISWPLWGSLYDSITSGQRADHRVFGKPFFEHLHTHPEMAALFNDGMKRFVSSITPAIVASYDFDRFQTVVDIGGGFGTLMSAILERHPRMQGVIFDLPATVEDTKVLIAHAGLGSRCTCVGGDFFKEVPRGDVLTLSAILSDWDDDESCRILSNCRRAVSPGGRVLIIERMLRPEEPAPATSFLDVQMLLIGGTGRTREEYARLLSQTGFELVRVIHTGTQRSIFEAQPVDV